MSSQKFSINGDKPFSRLQNNLLENQRWWPAFIKNDGEGGLTVDPVLYATNFGGLSVAEDGDRMDESNQPGIRIELIGNDGSVVDPGASTPLVRMAGAGTYSARMSIKNAGALAVNGFTFYLVAPGFEGGFYDETPRLTVGGGVEDHSWGGTSAVGQEVNELKTGKTTGPFPVFATLQDLADLVDQYQNQDISFLPHGMASRTDAIATAWAVDYTSNNTAAITRNPYNFMDTRVRTSALGDPFGRFWYGGGNKYRATVFMPMCLDVNQYSKTMVASNGISEPRFVRDDGTTSCGGYAKGYDQTEAAAGGERRMDDTTRFNPDPTGSDSASVIYKRVGESGDHKHGPGAGDRTASNMDDTLQQYVGDKTQTDIGRVQQGFAAGDTSVVPNPKYRMRMCLAAFLKDGDYDPVDGCLVPYTYDADRILGGANTTTIYNVWPGRIGYGGQPVGNAGIETAGVTGVTNYGKMEMNASIFPGFGFVQGPLCPSPQATNYTAGWLSIPATSVETAADFNPATWGIMALTREQQPMAGGGYVINPKRMTVWTFERDVNGKVTLRVLTDGLDAATDVNSQFRQAVGMPIYLTGLAVEDVGSAGSDTDWWLPVPATRGGGTPSEGMQDSTDKDLNGWWIISEIDNATFTHTYDGVSAQISEFKFETGQGNSIIAECNAGAVSPNSIQTGCYVQMGAPYGYAKADNATNRNPEYAINPYSSHLFGIGSAIGSGFGMFIMSPGGAIESPAMSNDYAPGRQTIRKVAKAGLGGILSVNPNYPYPRNAGPLSASSVVDPSAPAKSTKGQGVLRLPPGLGDMTTQYRGQWQTPSADSNYSEYDDRFTNTRWRGQILTTPLWSKMCQETGRHAWDHIKAPSTFVGQFRVGRNRCWPGHYRVGEGISDAPPFLFDKQFINEGNPTGSSGLYFGRFDNTDGGFTPSRKYGLREVSCSPIWLDAEFGVYLPQVDNRLTTIEFDDGRGSGFGRNAFMNWTEGINFDSPIAYVGGFLPINDGTTDDTYGSNRKPDRPAPNDQDKIPQSEMWVTPRPVFWAWGGCSGFNTGDWLGASFSIFEPFAAEPYAGFGDLSNPAGTGGQFKLKQGIHKIRTVFAENGMTLYVNGDDKGTDATCGSPIYQISATSHDFVTSSVSENNLAAGTTRTSFFNEATFVTQPQTTPEHNDFQIDTMVLRHIPTRAMLPFRVETRTINPAGDVAKFTSLVVEADHINEAQNQYIRVNICTPASNIPDGGGGESDQNVGTPIADFSNLDLSFAGGIGSVDLTDLPSGILATGFTVQFLFYVPDATQVITPPQWNRMPIIRNWTVEFDLKPTATLSVVGNTYNGDITSPVDTKVGHIISFRGEATTADPDRKVNYLRFNFGDGTQTDWLVVATPAASVTIDTAHTYVSTASGLTATVESKDDNENISAVSSAITINVANAAPVAILRAVPGMVRAGQTVRLDASSSYDVNAGGTVTDFTFTPGDGSSVVGPQAASFTDHTFAVAGEYMATVTCVDTDATTSNTAKALIKVLPATLIIPLTLNTKPTSFSRTRLSQLTQTSVLDAVYPEVSDTGQRFDDFTLEGIFIKTTADADIAFMEELLQSGALVEFEYQAVNFAGTADSKTFVGRMTTFDYSRAGGEHGQTPYSATFIREAGLGA